MNRKLAAGAIAIGMIAVAGCAPSGGSSDDVTLVVFGPNQFNTIPPNATKEVYTKIQDQLAEGFQKQHPEVTKIVFDAQGTFENEVSRTQNAQLAGEQMDVVVCAGNPTNTSYAPLGLLEPLDDLAGEVKGRLTEGALDAFTIDGTVWGIPLSGVAVTTFFYNKTLFDELGIAAPETYEEFVAAAPKISAAGVKPVAHNGKDLWMWPIWYMSGLAQTTDGAQLDKTIDNLKGKTKFTDDEDVKALELTRRWMDDGLLSPSVMDLDAEGLASSFLRGESASYFGASWDLPALRERVTDFELGIFLFPEYASVGNPSLAFGGIENGLCVAKSSKHKELAKDFIRYVTDDANAKTVLEGITPVATSHLVYAGSDDPISQQIRDQYLPASKFLDWVWPRELNDAIQRNIQAMMADSLSPKEAAQKIQEAYERLVSDGYEYGK
ncbi:MAG: extracellular solute-binding protein [Microbacterium sp.]